MSARRLVVTDHAVLRYLERVLHLDVDALRSAVLDGIDERTVDALATLDGKATMTEVTVGTSHRVRVLDGRVVTVLER